MAAGYGKGWITGDCVKSRPYTHIPQEDWDRIFKKVPAASLTRPCFAPGYQPPIDEPEWIEDGDRPKER